MNSGPETNTLRQTNAHEGRNRKSFATLFPPAGFLAPAVLSVLLALLGFSSWLAHITGIPAATIQAAILAIFTVGSWAFGLLPEPVTTLCFFLIAVLFGIAAPSEIFSGFSSPAWWLVFAGTITGMAVKNTGLGSRLASLLFGYSSTTYWHYVTAVALSAVLLAFIMPSTTGRVLLLVPIILALAERLGLEPGSNGRTGLILTAAAASYMPPTAILPANIPNGVLLGQAESIYRIKLTYGNYLLTHFPVLGILKTIALIWLVCRLYPEPGPLAVAPASRPPEMSREERLLTFILATTISLFATDFLHHVSPAWISLAAAVVCLLPATGILPAKTFSEQMHITPLIYVAGFLGLGMLVSSTGLGEHFSRALLRLIGLAPEHAAPANLASLALIGACIGLLTTLPALPAILTPLADTFAKASGLSIYTVLMLQVPIFSTVFLPYQSPPMMIAMQLGGVSIGSGAKLCLALALITVTVLLPLDYLWWQMLGVIK